MNVCLEKYAIKQIKKGNVVNIVNKICSSDSLDLDTAASNRIEVFHTFS